MYIYKTGLSLCWNPTNTSTIMLIVLFLRLISMSLLINVLFNVIINELRKPVKDEVDFKLHVRLSIKTNSIRGHQTRKDVACSSCSISPQGFNWICLNSIIYMIVNFDFKRFCKMTKILCYILMSVIWCQFTRIYTLLHVCLISK